MGYPFMSDLMGLRAPANGNIAADPQKIHSRPWQVSNLESPLRREVVLRVTTEWKLQPDIQRHGRSRCKVAFKKQAHLERI
jgi:hypothetical protein